MKHAASKHAASGLVAFALATLLAPATVTFAQPRPDAAAGRAIAERWCAACHLVGQDQRSATAAVASFAEIARRHAGSPAVLEGFLADPHPPMPDLSLTRQEIRDLVAYIGSLR
ncbi:c-type cytochrome [Phreatobacter sp.]|uniref:c-type cytochrome n=1 Tax=Phreatobacter sp. TaxID=1966341 RepID=UPI003F717D9A